MSLPLPLQVEEVTNVLKELEKSFYDIPFENSDFQNKNFVLAAQYTPGRAYRAIGLRMFSKIRAVKEALYGMQLNDIDIEENEYKIAASETSSFDKRRLAIENAKSLESRKWTEKLLNDALRELNCLYVEFKKYPSYTREQFEQEERLHFEVKLQQQISTNGGGAQESLANMSLNSDNLEKMLDEPLFLEELIKESTQLRLQSTMKVENETVRQIQS